MDDDTPLYEVLFMVNYQICKEFPAFTPFAIENTSFYEVLQLYIDLRTLQIRENDELDTNSSNDNKVIRVPAGDNWF